MAIVKMKKLKKLEMDQIFHQVVSYESQLLGFDEHWKKWLYNADRELNHNYPSSTLSGCKNYNNTRCWFKYFANFWIEDNGSCKVGYREGVKEGYTYFDIYQAYIGKNNNIASREFLKLFDIKPDKKYNNIFGIESDEIPRVECKQYIEQVPEVFVIKKVQFNKTGVFELYNDSDLIIGAYIRYASNDEYFYVYGKIEKSPHMGEFYLKIGRPNGDIPIFNMNELTKYDVPVLFIMSIEDAISNDCGIDKSNEIKYTVCSCLDLYGNSHIDFSFLYGKDIYFVPEPASESILKCIKYLDEFEVDSESYRNTEKIIVSSVRISKGFLPFVDRTQKEKLENSSDPFKRHLATCCEEDEIKLEEQSLPPDKYKGWLREMGVLPPADSNVEKQQSIFVSFDNQESTYSKDSLEHYLRRTMITGIIGESNAGKTLLGYTMAACLASGKDFLDFTVEKTHSVLYFDAETGKHDAQEMMKRIFTGYDISEKVIHKGLYILPLLDISPSGMSEDKLMNDDFQKWIKNSIKEYNAEYVFFDNLASLGRNLENHFNWPKIKDIFRKIENNMCSVVYLHHLKHDGDISGSRKIEDLSQNIITLRGRNTVKHKYDDIVPQNIQPADCLFELEYKKSKGDNRRNGAKQVWLLKADPADIKKDGKWMRLDVPKNDTKESVAPELRDQVEAIFCERLGREPVLEGGKKEKEWKQDVLLLYAIKRYLNCIDAGESWFALSDVKALFESSDQDKRNQLKPLVEAKLLEEKVPDKQKKEKGKQRATRWKYRTEN